MSQAISKDYFLEIILETWWLHHRSGIIRNSGHDFFLGTPLNNCYPGGSPTGRGKCILGVNDSPRIANALSGC